MTEQPSSNFKGPKHPLQTAWTIWTYPRLTSTQLTQRRKDSTRRGDPQPDAAALYERDLKASVTFDTVEEFFKAWEMTAKPSEMASETNVAIFREGTKPMWESFPSGGRFVFRVRRPLSNADKGQRNSTQSIDKKKGLRDKGLLHFVDQLWEGTVFRLIGEIFELPEIVGAVCSARGKEVVLSLWVMNADHIGLRNGVREHCRNLVEECRREQKEESFSVLVQFNAFELRLREQTEMPTAARRCSAKDHAQKEDSGALAPITTASAVKAQ